MKFYNTGHWRTGVQGGLCGGKLSEMDNTQFWLSLGSALKNGSEWKMKMFTEQRSGRNILNEILHLFDLK